MHATRSRTSTCRLTRTAGPGRTICSAGSTGCCRVTCASSPWPRRTRDWASYDDGLLVAPVVADAFCHSMVRSLVGALLAVGDGRKPVDFPASLLGAAQRAGEVTVAPPHGLTLVKISYPAPEQFAE